MLCFGNNGPKDAKQESQSKKIDAQLKEDRNKAETSIKLLLLGTGESGKSTTIKQAKLIFGEGFTDIERENAKRLVHFNVIQGVGQYTAAAETLNIPLLEQTEKLAEPFISSEYLITETTLSPEIVAAIKQIWKDPAIPKIAKRDHEFQVIEALPYYIQHLDRIATENYVPTDQDILYSRIATTGIQEFSFTLADLAWKLVDVGGQRSERRKWIHCFDDVTAILFCVATSEYNQKLVEDESVNRMDESITLYEQIISYEFFTKTPIILFLNKMDLFEEKIKDTDLACCFSEYTGGCNKEKALQFIKKKFTELHKSKSKAKVYIHECTATDTDNIRKIFNNVRDIVMTEFLENTKML